MSRPSWRSRGVVLALLLLTLLAAAALPADAQPTEIGIGMQFETWGKNHLLVAFASLRLGDIFLFELGIPVIPVKAIMGLPAVGAKLYLGKIELGTYALRPFLGGGGLLVGVIPIIIEAFGGAELSFSNFNLFAEAGLSYTIMCCPGCPPSPLFALGMRLDF